MDKLFIRDLEAEAKIGVYDWEREVLQKLLVDLEMLVDTRLPAETDSISDALDYAEVAKKLLTHMENSEYFLIEALAEDLSKLVIREFKVSWVRISLRKPSAIPSAAEVGIVVERGSDD